MFDPNPNGSIIDQLEAFRGVILRCIAGIAIGVIPGFIAAPYLLKHMVQYACPPEIKLHYFSLLEPFFVQINMGLIIGVAATSWWIFWQVGAFIAPGLYRNEKSALLKMSLISAFLFLLGGSFGFFAVLPLVMKFSYSFATTELQPVIGVGDFLGMATMLMLGFGGSFQFPVILVLLAKLGIIKPQGLRKKRPVVITVIFVVAAFLTPPDIISQLCMALPAWLLFEVTLKWIERIPAREESAVPENTICDPATFSSPAVPKNPPPAPGKKRRKIRPL